MITFIMHLKLANRERDILIENDRRKKLAVCGTINEIN